MEIRSRAGFPAGTLSNFSPHAFELDGVQIASMEGFLQSLKFENPHEQAEVCKLVGSSAKKRGRAKPLLWSQQTFYWKGAAFKRDSVEYQELLDRAYSALCSQSEEFRRALLATGDAALKHSMGRTKACETVLTKAEFCSRLIKLRRELQDQKGLLQF